MTEIDQIRTDLLFLAKRCKIVEDAVIRIENALLAFDKDIHEWSEFMAMELLKQGVIIHKNKLDRQEKFLRHYFDYLQNMWRETQQQNYEKFESLFKRTATFFNKKKKGSYY